MLRPVAVPCVRLVVWTERRRCISIVRQHDAVVRNWLHRDVVPKQQLYKFYHPEHASFNAATTQCWLHQEHVGSSNSRRSRCKAGVSLSNWALAWLCLRSAGVQQAAASASARAPAPAASLQLCVLQYGNWCGRQHADASIVYKSVLLSFVLLIPYLAVVTVVQRWHDNRDSMLHNECSWLTVSQE